jgi:hemoglobin-like flavoprotein
MTPSQIRLLQRSFVKIEPIAASVSAEFYDRLFRIAPETRSLFKEDMSYQYAKFMSVISELVNLHLRSLISLPVTSQGGCDAAMPGVRALGHRHNEFGVKPEHFVPMREALMDTLADTLGDDFSPAVREAWEEAFDLLARVMKSGLLNVAPSGPHILERFARGRAGGGA